MSKNRIKPFLRWIGGKQALVKHLIKHLPCDCDWRDRTYFEPFVGAGSLFFTIRPSNAALSDINPHLIHCFKAIRENPLTVHRYAREHEKNSSKDYYYAVRQMFNRGINTYTTAQAARFLYLNRTCFNGIFRVNEAGLFNVPFGAKENLCFPTREEFLRTSSVLRTVKLASFSYEGILTLVRKGDFVYLDPPYPPVNGTAYFTHYTKDRFAAAEQQQVARFANELKKRGCLVMMSNADMPWIRDLYCGWNSSEIEVTRYVTCKSKRYKVSELIITNY